ncbi:MAG: Serine--tRNA ligase, mitochondrial [Thelocarpon impressellum]|nr:MAG: Serine--tRNA ligase, mitochondrial [Thelocarpon impressellum]
MSHSFRPSFVCQTCRHWLAVDIKHIRKNAELYAQNCVDRNYASQRDDPYRIVGLHEKWQGVQRDARGLRERYNAVKEQLARLSNGGGPQGEKQKLLGEGQRMKEELAAFEAQEEASISEMEELARKLPNLTSKETPIGSEARVVGQINEHLEASASSRSHVEIGEKLQLVDFAAARSSSGYGWYYLLNEAALLEQALVQYALSVALRSGWRVVSPPSMVYGHMASACGFMPRDAHGETQIYSIHRGPDDLKKPKHCLAGTAEIPLAAMKAGVVFDEAELPVKTVGVSRCFRAEAGARGLQSKGLYRVHEFTKVEMFAWTSPSDSSTYDEMQDVQHAILRSLNLPCRVLEMPSRDLGGSALRKRDVEASFPSRASASNPRGWGEVTSASLCGEYQTRRLETRMRPAGKGKLAYPHTANGTALAVPRVLAALLENGWDEQRQMVRLPEALWPWMGMEAIGPRT